MDDEEEDANDDFDNDYSEKPLTNNFSKFNDDEDDY